MFNLAKINLTNVKLNGNVNTTVTLPSNEKDVERFLALEGVDSSIEKDAE